MSWWAGDGNPSDTTGNNPGTAENGTTYAPGKVRQAFSYAPSGIPLFAVKGLKWAGLDSRAEALIFRENLKKIYRLG